MRSVSSVRELRSEEITVREVQAIDEYRQCEAMQAKIWGPDDVAGTGRLDLITAQHNGGLVLGAFHPDGRLVGYVYSFAGVTPSGQLKQCSITLGVDPDHQKSGIGYRLKMAQREATLAKGMDLITWTFDPLLSLNAHFNLNKLGANVTDYLVNVYGPGSGLNSGLDTDRLVTEWRLRPTEAAPAPSAAHRQEATVVTRVDRDHLGVAHCLGADLQCQDEALLIEIPPDIQAVKSADRAIARGWRRNVRHTFLNYLSMGYVVVGFRPPRSGSRFLPGYVLARTPCT